MRRPFSHDWPLTQRFGENPDTYAQFGLKGHNGLDYGTPSGTPVLASLDGKVIEAVRSGDSGYGKYVKIESDKYGSLVAHLQRVDVEVGQEVREGDQLGLSDNTGFSTGPHLHWGVFPIPRDRNNGYAGYIDQTSLIDNGNVFLGKPKDYWLQVEKDRESLLKTEGELKNQVHELGIALDAEKEKSKTLDEFVGDLATLLSVPKDQAEIRKAIVEDMSQIDSLARLTKEIEDLKSSLVEAAKKTSEDTQTILNLTNENKAATDTLQTTKNNLEKVEAEYKVLLSTIGQPLMKLRLGKILLALFRAELGGEKNEKNTFYETS